MTIRTALIGDFGMKMIVAAVMAAMWVGCAHAQGLQRIPSCGDATPPAGLSPGYMNSAGNECVNATSKPSTLTIVPLDVATVTTGGTAVTALTAGHKTGGGWMQNPPSATINLCIAEIGTASGTTSAGNTTCIAPGQTYALVPSAGAVSVVSSDSAHPFSGEGLQ